MTPSGAASRRTSVGRRRDGLRAGRAVAALATTAALISACSAAEWTQQPQADAPAPAPAPTPSVVTPPAPPPAGAPSAPVLAPDAAVEAPTTVRPAWLGTRVLELAADGFGVRVPTPPELVDRRFPPRPPHPSLPVPPADGTFAASIAPLDDATLARSTWRDGCPVARDELRHVTVVHTGFDGHDHTGELIVHADVAADVVGIFRALHAARFPLEEVRIIAADELELPPTGDGNTTTGFVCRTMVSGARWSEHAYGRAIDVNPFHNPYVRGDVVLPELAGAYVDRSDLRPGMLAAGDVVTTAFAAAGWRWGGTWVSGPDWMHFSTTGR
jgi:hypothetical protein